MKIDAPLLSLAPLVCTGCLATQASLEGLNSTAAELESAVLELKAAQGRDDLTAREVAEIEARVMRLGSEAAERARELPASLKQDVERLKSIGEGVTGLGPAGDAAGISGLLVALGGRLLWAMRDRRKYMGRDPLQSSSTPATMPPPSPQGGGVYPTR